MTRKERKRVQKLKDRLEAASQAAESVRTDTIYIDSLAPMPVTGRVFKPANVKSILHLRELILQAEIRESRAQDTLRMPHLTPTTRFQMNKIRKEASTELIRLRTLLKAEEAKRRG